MGELAADVLGDRLVMLARQVMERGEFAGRAGIELAGAVLAQEALPTPQAVKAATK